jgi:O-antigen ligase
MPIEQEELTLPKNNQSIWINAIEVIIIALIILVSVAYYPHCITVFSPIKETIAEILVIIGLMFWGLKLTDKGKFKFVSAPTNLPLLSFIFILILSLFWSDSLFTSLQQLPLFLIGPFLYFTIINNIQRQQQINRIITTLLIIGSLFGIYGILQYNGIDFVLWAKNVGRLKIFDLFGNVNYFAEYLIVPLPIAVSLFFVSRNKIKKLLLLIGILAMGGSLILTFTRSSYLGFGTSLIFMFFLFIFSRGKRFIKDNKNIFIILSLIIILTMSLIAIPNPLNKSDTVISKIKSRASIAQLTQGHSIKRRIATWKFTALMIKDHPLIGSGIGTFRYNTLKYQAKFFEQGENRSLYPSGFADKAHNEYLQLWAELGIIGLLVFLWFLICYFNYGLKILKKIKDYYKQGIVIGLMGSVLAVLVDALFGFPLHLPATIVLFWLCIGLTVAIGRNEAAQTKDEELETKNTNFSPFKLLLYLGIIFLSGFLCVTMVRPFIARTYWYYGNKEIEKGNVDGNIKNYEKALQYNPYFGEVYYSMGLTLINKEFYDLSQEYFEKAEKLIDHPSLPKNLAFVYLNKGQLDKAAIKLEQAISYQSDEKSMIPLYIELGKTYIRIKKYELAEIAFKDTLKIDPDSISAHYGLGNVYLRQDGLQEALNEFQEIIKISPDSSDAEYAEKAIEEIKKRLNEKMEK